MSYVADVILTTAVEDSDGGRLNVDRLNEWINTRCGIPDALRGLDEHAGGSKAMQCGLYGTAINYLDVDGLVTAFRAIPWAHPECAQLMIKNEHDDLFTIYLTEPIDPADLDIAHALLHQLRTLGATYGPLGVALAAARLTDPDVLVARLRRPHAAPQPPEEQP